MKKYFTMTARLSKVVFRPAAFRPCLTTGLAWFYSNR